MGWNIPFDKVSEVIDWDGRAPLVVTGKNMVYDSSTVLLKDMKDMKALLGGFYHRVEQFVSLLLLNLICWSIFNLALQLKSVFFYLPLFWVNSVFEFDSWEYLQQDDTQTPQVNRHCAARVPLHLHSSLSQTVLKLGLRGSIAIGLNVLDILEKARLLKTH